MRCVSKESINIITRTCALVRLRLFTALGIYNYHYQNSSSGLIVPACCILLLLFCLQENQIFFRPYNVSDTVHVLIVLYVVCMNMLFTSCRAGEDVDWYQQIQ